MVMKRRNRKRSSKAARPAKIPVDAEKPAGPSVTLAGTGDGTHPRHQVIAPVDVEKAAEPSIAPAGSDYVTDLSNEFIAAVEAEEPASNSSAPVGRDGQTHPGDDFTVAVEEEKSAGPSVALAGADRRTHPRYEFIAAVEVLAGEYGSRVGTRARGLSPRGCYVGTSKAPPFWTGTGGRITKGGGLV